MPTAALVTGGARRIGKAIALRLGSLGFDVALHYLHSREAAEQVQAALRDVGCQCELFQADLSQREQVQSLARAVHKRFELEVLVNSASLFEPSAFPSEDTDRLDRLYSVNLQAPYLLTNHFARSARRGLVLNLLDANITKHASGHFEYLLTKKWLAEFTRMAAVRLAPGIRVNGICPGPILPPLGTGVDHLEAVAQLVPLARPGSPKRIGDCVDYLVRNDYVTGSLLYVDGGQHL